MCDISHFVAMGGGPEAIAQATLWLQKGFDVANSTRQSKKGKGKTECDLAYVVLLFHLGLMQSVSVFFFFFLFPHYIYLYLFICKLFFRRQAKMIKPVSRSRLF